MNTNSRPKEFQLKKWVNPTQTPIYWSWINMIRRCHDEKHVSYARYGGEGISVCNRWRNSFDDFCVDIGEKPNGKTLDRIDNNGNYDPGNCRWATPAEQGQNRSTNTLTFDLAIQIIKEIKAGASISGTARKYGRNRRHISDLASGEIWKDAMKVALKESENEQ